jgi:SAM-dependent methyltransferase
MIMSHNELDQGKMEAFAEQMAGILNSGALALMTSIGHRRRLFDVLAGLPPATSGQIAEVVGLNERYVREWLYAMVTGRIVEYDPAYELFHLPPEHAAWLTRAATPNNLAVTAQNISLLGAVEDQIVDVFRNGGGVPYTAFHRFHEVMAEESGQSVVAGLADHILPLVPGLTDALQRGIDVLDLGCGSGRALNLMAETFPGSRFSGYDFSLEAITTARQAAEKKKLKNVHFEVKDATTLSEPERYDLICTFDAIHDQAQPATVLRNIYQALRPGGVYLMQDIGGSSHVEKNLDHPLAPFLYTISTMHCMTVSLAENGAGLGTMWGKELALQMLREAGFTNVQIHELPHDPINYFYVMTR